MLPDFASPAASFLALCKIRFRERADGSAREIQSDYRCQLRYVEEEEAPGDAEARLYLVGQGAVQSLQDVPVILAFLDGEEQRGRCRVGTRFELCEGDTVTADGTVHSLAIR